ncbi:carboxypeptidase [Plakobranchus ocellatus]|uniref:Carboxypeptidase n=1 Tax=Plakobranchus ocellatus TaxID=259542 RepID=A0AAV4C846_9GAST|nr:carboxypeptidase [Plakobranchus ocellatus]
MPGNFRQMSQMFCLVTVLVIMAISPAWSAPEEDLITDLPYLTFTPTFRQYSGYLRALDGKMLHYWFIESENSPQSDPLVLWLNGGPGCSSLFGLLGENGPLRMVPERAVEKNPFGWTKVANMLYLEAPAGVGFSFSKSKDYSTNDDDTAINNFAALKDFFRKFPEYKDHDFYISGESYAGYYIPTLVSLIIDSPVFNLKGFFIGNSFSSATLNSDGKLYFIADHGLISQQLFTKLLDSCCPVKDTSNCSFSIRSAFSEKCRLTINEALRGLNNLDPYNIYAETTTQSENSCDPMLNLQNQLYLAGNKNRTIKVPTCELYGDSLSDYLNLPEVRRALHIPQEVKTWVQCAETLVTSTSEHRNRQEEGCPYFAKALFIMGFRAVRSNALFRSEDDTALNLDKTSQRFSTPGYVLTLDHSNSE